MQYLSHSDALKYVQREAGLSRETFDLNIRTRLIERRYGERVVRFSKLAIDQALADPTFKEGSMKLPKRRTLADALEHVLTTEWQHQKGARQQRRLTDLLCKEKLAAKPARKIRYTDLEDWVNEQRTAGLKEATIARRLSAIMKALRRAKTKEWIDSVPDKPPLHIDNYKHRYMTRDEVALLLDSCGERVVMYHVIGFLLDTGCRMSELMRLRPQDVTDDGVIFMDRKTGGNLKIPLTARSRAATEALFTHPWWLHWTRHIHDSDKDLRDIAIENLRTRISREFRKICAIAGLKDVSIHTCRHTFGSWLAQAGTPMHIIQQLMGHRDITVTSKRYAHLSPSSLHGVLNVFESHDDNNVVDFPKQRKMEK